jgi:uroporphyrinogen-III synthase
LRRVAVTASREQAPRVAEAMTGHGLDPVVLPCISIRPTRSEELAGLRERAAEADLILITSARTVSVTWPRGGMPAVPVAAVGPSSARAVRDAGGEVAFVGSGGAAELVSGLEVDGMNVVFPHARAADPATVATLTRMGATVHAVPVYDTVAIAPGPDRVEAVAFGSAMSVAGWCLSRSLDGVLVGAIGRSTAAAVRQRGVLRPLVPERPGFMELAGLMARRLD